MDDVDLAALITSWELALRAARKSPNTIDTYLRNARAYLDWCTAENLEPTLERRRVVAHLAAISGTRAGATARTRLVSLRSLSRWAASEDEITRDELREIEFPKADDEIVHPLSSEELAAILKACEGRRLMDRRDTAIVRILICCGGRAAEIVNMRTDEVDPVNAMATIHGKGGKDRLIPLDDYTCQAVDRYLRMRRRHPLADTPQLWLGQNGDSFTYWAMWKTIKRRAESAGIEDVHPHRFRHTFADRWLEAGGSEGGLMSVAGWSDYSMVRRYSRARANKRALDEAKRLNLGEL